MYRNPSPPPFEEAESSKADFIANTVYSKHWVLSVLVKLLQYAQTATEGCETIQSSFKEETEMEGEWEQELCKLWDASADEDVSKFLYEANATDVALRVTTVTQLPRLREICIGLLGNMACCQLVCNILCQHQDFMSVTVA